MPYDFSHYAAELVRIVTLPARPGWSPEAAAKMYLEHAYKSGQEAELQDMLSRVTGHERES